MADNMSGCNKPGAIARLLLVALTSVLLVSCGSGDEPPASSDPMPGNGTSAGDGNGGGDTGTGGQGATGDDTANPPGEPANDAVGSDGALADNPLRLYIFGDSLSDTGNLGRPASFGFNLPAPFFMNRITNGKVIVDYVAESLNTTATASNYLSNTELGTNYAVAGAQALDSSALVDLSVEVDVYLRNNSSQPDPQDVFLFFIGGNDVIDAVGRGDQAIANLDAAASEVGAAVNDIVSRGGSKIVVLNVPNIGRTPKMLSAGQAARATALTDHFNAAVSAQLASIDGQGLRLITIDVYAIFDDVLSRAAELGYTNTTQACYLTDRLRFNDICSNSQLDSFVFFDSIHPSGKTHQLIGEAVARQVNTALATP